LLVIFAASSEIEQVRKLLGRYLKASRENSWATAHVRTNTKQFSMIFISYIAPFINYELLSILFILLQQKITG